MDSKNLSFFSLTYWKIKFEYIWSIIYIFLLCFLPIPEKKGIKTEGAIDNGRGGYTNLGGYGKSSRGCSGGG